MKTKHSKIGGLAATIQRYSETYRACACNEADRWEAGRFLEAAKQLRSLEAETQELAEALEEAINKRAAMCEWRTDSPEVTGRPEKWVRDELCIKWRAVLASHRAKQEVQS